MEGHLFFVSAPWTSLDVRAGPAAAGQRQPVPLPLPLPLLPLLLLLQLLLLLAAPPRLMEVLELEVATPASAREDEETARLCRPSQASARPAAAAAKDTRPAARPGSAQSPSELRGGRKEMASRWPWLPRPADAASAERSAIPNEAPGKHPRPLRGLDKTLRSASCHVYVHSRPETPGRRLSRARPFAARPCRAAGRARLTTPTSINVRGGAAPGGRSCPPHNPHIQ
jgi:hypothetical protein